MAESAKSHYTRGRGSQLAPSRAPEHMVPRTLSPVLPADTRDIQGVHRRCPLGQDRQPARTPAWLQDDARDPTAAAGVGWRPHPRGPRAGGRGCRDPGSGLASIAQVRITGADATTDLLRPRTATPGLECPRKLATPDPRPSDPGRAAQPRPEPPQSLRGTKASVRCGPGPAEPRIPRRPRLNETPASLVTAGGE